MESVKKQFHKHSLEPYGGTALLSTPAEDPNEKNPAKITGWKKLNKVKIAYNYSLILFSFTTCSLKTPKRL
jgi:hypothetical protein